jgi:integrase
VPEQPVPVVAADTLARLLGACSGNGYEHRRDTALIALLLDTGIRRAECAGIKLTDVDLEAQTIVVTGKGSRQRTAKYGEQVAIALDRYLRARRRHPSADSPYLWLGSKGGLTDSGIAQMLERRSDQAGIGRVHAHQFRHTFAHQWRLAGGNDDALMSLGGWRSPQMLQRYGRSAAAERAREAHERLSPADRMLGA